MDAGFERGTCDDREVGRMVILRGTGRTNWADEGGEEEIRAAGERGAWITSVTPLHINNYHPDVKPNRIRYIVDSYSQQLFAVPHPEFQSTEYKAIHPPPDINQDKAESIIR